MTSITESGARSAGVYADGTPRLSPTPRSPVAVTALSTTAVKGLHLDARNEVMLTPTGVPDNRRFYLVDEAARMVNGKRIGVLAAVRADYDPDTDRLALTFPDGARATGTVRLGGALDTHFFSRTLTTRLVDGPWSEALSRYAGTPLRLVQADPGQGGVDRGPRGAVSLVSRASVERLASLAGRSVDPRRFRMLIEVDGLEAHAEDAWVGHTVRIGAARIAIHGHVGRCLVTSHCPDRGITDMPTLKLLAYRRAAETTEALAFGVYGEVLDPGPVRIGDALVTDRR